MALNICVLHHIWIDDYLSRLWAKIYYHLTEKEEMEEIQMKWNIHHDSLNINNVYTYHPNHPYIRYLTEKKKLCNGYELGFLTMKVDQICIRYLNESDKDFSMHSKFLHLLRYESLVFEDIVLYWLWQFVTYFPRYSKIQGWWP